MRMWSMFSVCGHNTSDETGPVRPCADILGGMGKLWDGIRSAHRHRKALVDLGDCGECGHLWGDHPGGWVDLADGECSECRYEVDHEQRETDIPICRQHCPNAPD